MALFIRNRWRRYSSAQWAAENPVLLDGEPGWDSTLKKFKVGDGVNAWATLDFYSAGGGGGGGLDAEGVRDVMAVALVEGAGIDITVDDPGNTITIAAVGVPIADGSVTTPKLADGAVTPAKLDNSTAIQVLYNGTNWGTYSTDPNKVRRFRSDPYTSTVAAPTAYNIYDTWDRA